MGKGDIKVYSFANDMILHIKDCKDTTRHSLKLKTHPVEYQEINIHNQ